MKASAHNRSSCIFFLSLLLILLMAAITLATAPPVGIQLDIEPYSLPQWDNDTNSVANQFLDLIEKLVELTAPPKIPLVFAIPRWFDTSVNVTRNSQTRPLNEWIQDKSNIVVMDYVNSASRAISDGAGEVSYGNSRPSSEKRRVVLAFETMELPEEPMATFFNQTSAQFEGALTEIYAAFKGESSFDGVAVHYYDTWKVMNPTCSIPSTSPIRDLYLWDYEVAFDQVKQNNFFAYVSQQRNKIRRVYFESRALLLNEDTRVQLAAFSQRLKDHSIQLELLSGADNWALKENHDKAISFVTNSVDFIRNLTMASTGASINSANNGTSMFVLLVSLVLILLGL